MLQGTNLEYVKAFNRRVVLETVRLHGPLSRSRVARITRLTPPTISNIVQDLLGEGLLRESGQQQGRRGPPSISLEVDPGGAFAIGISLATDHAKALVVDLAGMIVQEASYDADHVSPAAGLSVMTRMVGELRKSVPSDRLRGVGVGLPGPIDPTERTLANIADFPDWVGFPIEDRLSASVDLPVFVENNATAAALGERWYGAGREVDNFFYLYIGPGLGGGVVLRGAPYHGHTGFAGEPVLIPVDAASDGEVRRLGDFLSLSALEAALGTSFGNLRDSERLRNLFVDRHEGLMSWLEQAAARLAPVLVSVEYLLDPERIFFAGRFPTEILKRLIELTDARLETLRWPRKPYKPPLVLAEAGPDAAALGVATLPMYEALAPTNDLVLKRLG